eukprot:GHVT01006026.1.p1 GENE.GHVT01006026.1~~GHVT01006026.1.p1  ORF type:complete len:148 (+),score=9.04 GHVT01006026.1:39-482(+)
MFAVIGRVGDWLIDWGMEVDIANGSLNRNFMLVQVFNRAESTIALVLRLRLPNTAATTQSSHMARKSTLPTSLNLYGVGSPLVVRWLLLDLRVMRGQRHCCKWYCLFGYCCCCCCCHCWATAAVGPVVSICCYRASSVAVGQVCFHW